MGQQLIMSGGHKDSGCPDPTQMDTSMTILNIYHLGEDLNPKTHHECTGNGSPWHYPFHVYLPDCPLPS